MGGLCGNEMRLQAAAKDLPLVGHPWTTSLAGRVAVLRARFAYDKLHSGSAAFHRALKKKMFFCI